MTKEILQPLSPKEYARLIELEGENNYGLPAGRYLLTNRPREVDIRAKLILGPATQTEIVGRDKRAGLFIVTVISAQPAE